jgi:predicted nucleic acid-binding protein
MSMYLIDKSAFARIVTSPVVASRVGSLVAADRVATCGVVDLEVLYSARNSDDYAEMRAALSGLPREEITDDHFGQALAIQRRLVETGKHRLSVPDLVIASVALLADLTVLHYDHDYDIIAEVSELQHEWVAPRGTL